MRLLALALVFLASPTAAQGGGALRFDGDDDFAQSDASFDSAAVTVEAWVRVTKILPTPCCFFAGLASWGTFQNAAWEIYFHPDDEAATHFLFTGRINWGKAGVHALSTPVAPAIGRVAPLRFHLRRHDGARLRGRTGARRRRLEHADLGRRRAVPHRGQSPRAERVPGRRRRRAAHLERGAHGRRAPRLGLLTAHRPGAGAARVLPDGRRRGPDADRRLGQRARLHAGIDRWSGRERTLVDPIDSGRRERARGEPRVDLASRPEGARRSRLASCAPGGAFYFVLGSASGTAAGDPGRRRSAPAREPARPVAGLHAEARERRGPDQHARSPPAGAGRPARRSTCPRDSTGPSPASRSTTRTSSWAPPAAPSRRATRPRSSSFPDRSPPARARSSANVRRHGRARVAPGAERPDVPTLVGARRASCSRSTWAPSRSNPRATTA